MSDLETEQPSEVARALIVDDSSSVRMMARGLLSELGFEIAGDASTGEEALELCKSIHPHFVLLDINMPGIGGIKTLQRLMDYNPNLDVVMLTSEAGMYNIDDSINLGAKGFIRKDQPLDKLLEELQGVINTIYFG